MAAITQRGDTITVASERRLNSGQYFDMREPSWRLERCEGAARTPVRVEETSGTAHFLGRFATSALPPGDYVLSVGSGEHQISEPFSIADDNTLRINGHAASVDVAFCRFWGDLNRPCNREGVQVTAEGLPHDREPVTFCRCPQHGGLVETIRLVAHDWNVAAPPEVGGEYEVTMEGARTLTSDALFAVVRPTPSGRFAASVGLGGYTRTVGEYGDKEEASRVAVAAAGKEQSRQRLEITARRGGDARWGMSIAEREPRLVLCEAMESAWDALARLGQP